MSKIVKFLFSLETKVLFFFTLYIIALFGSAIFPFNFFYAILTCLLIIVLWKIVLGLSWVNFAFLFFAFLEVNVIKAFFRPFWVIIFIFLFLFFFWQKCFAYKNNKNSERKSFDCLTNLACSKMEKYWREILFYYLFLTWIIIAYGLYFFLNYFFSISFLIYFSGLMIFANLYLVFSNVRCSNYLVSFWILLLVNLQFFVLFSYLSLNVLILSLLLALVFRFSAYFLERKHSSIVLQ